MLDQDFLEQHLYDLILDLCTVLYAKGHREVPVGAMMRLIGIADEHAAKHDEHVFELDEDFERIMKERQYQQPLTVEQRPLDATLH